MNSTVPRVLLAFGASVLCAPRSDAQSINSFCFGDGAGTPCPCGNNSPPGLQQGCINSFGQGSHLAGSGSISVANDTLTLSANHLPTTTTIIFFQGMLAQNAGLGTALGDGLLCVNSGLIRMGVRSAAGGSASFGYGVAGDPRISVAGSLPATGGLRFYQGWYRNAAAFCAVETFNLTNGLSVTWEL